MCRAVFGINRLSKMGIVMRLHAFNYSTRDPLRAEAFDISPAFHKTLLYGRQTRLQAKHTKLGVKRLDSLNDFIKIVAAAESHRDYDRPRSAKTKQSDARDRRPAPQDDVLVIVRSRPIQFDPLRQSPQNEPDPFRIIDGASGKRTT